MTGRLPFVDLVDADVSVEKVIAEDAGGRQQIAEPVVVQRQVRTGQAEEGALPARRAERHRQATVQAMRPAALDEGLSLAGAALGSGQMFQFAKEDWRGIGKAVLEDRIDRGCSALQIMVDPLRGKIRHGDQARRGQRHRLAYGEHIVRHAGRATEVPADGFQIRQVRRLRQGIAECAEVGIVHRYCRLSRSAGSHSSVKTKPSGYR